MKLLLKANSQNFCAAVLCVAGASFFLFHVFYQQIAGKHPFGHLLKNSVLLYKYKNDQRVKKS
jgi:hypothetical protein